MKDGMNELEWLEAEQERELVQVALRASLGVGDDQLVDEQEKEMLDLAIRESLNNPESLMKRKCWPFKSRSTILVS